MTSMGLGSRKHIKLRPKRDYLGKNYRDGLQGSELSRQKAEDRRAFAEQTRGREAVIQANDEETRNVSEEMRDSAERGRAFAEKERSRQENRRQKAENVRMTAEEARHAAEDLRVIAEETRRTTELLREAYIEQLEVIKEMRTSLAEYDQAARAYYQEIETLKRERALGGGRVKG